MELTVIGFTWICYFTMHSMLATDLMKTRLCEQMPGLARYYRLIYNTYALVTLIVPVALVLGFRGADLFAPSGIWGVADRLVQLASVIGLLWSLSAYNFGELSGFKPAISPPELSAKGPLKLCRHPIYLFGLLLIWTGAHNAATLLSAILITLYIFVGMRIEEHRLEKQFGAAYREYQQTVPMLLPWPRARAKSS